MVGQNDSCHASLNFILYFKDVFEWVCMWIGNVNSGPATHMWTHYYCTVTHTITFMNQTNVGTQDLLILVFADSISSQHGPDVH
jgi:hypothetical protein